MPKQRLLFLILTTVFLACSSALFLWAMMVKDLAGMGYLMGLFTVCWINAAFLFVLSKRGGAVNI